VFWGGCSPAAPPWVRPCTDYQNVIRPQAAMCPGNITRCIIQQRNSRMGRGRGGKGLVLQNIKLTMAVDWTQFGPRQGQEIFRLLQRPERLWRPHSPLFKGTGAVSRGWSGHSVKLTTHLHPVQTLRRELSSSAAMLIRSALFWGITQRRTVILYRCFGTTYRSNLQGSRSPRRFLDP
jgi:hypothetical protein